MHDPEGDPDEALREYGVTLSRWDDLPRADAIVAAVAHKQYRQLTIAEIGRKAVAQGCFVDVKSVFDAGALEAAGLHVWRL